MDLNTVINKLSDKLNSNKFFEVIKEGSKLIKKYPDKFVFYNILGLAYQGIHQLEEAEKYFLKAIEVNPNEFAPKNNLANTYTSLGKLDESEKLFRKIISQVNTNPIVFANYSHLKKKLNDYNAARDLLEKAVSIDKNNLEFNEELASCYQSLGNFEKSKEICQKILMKDPNHVPAHIILSRQTNYKENDDHLNQMVNLHKEKKLDPDNKIKICFALGKAYEDKKNFEKSFKYISEANNSQDNKVQYKIENDQKIIESIKFFFSRVDAKLYKKNFNEKKIIFIVGLPRSGTTLVEQIISSHSKVNGAGELIYLKKSIDKLFFEENKIIDQNLNQEINSERNLLNKMYFKCLENHNFDKNIITDKAPQNFMWIGFIKFFFPNSKLIHCYRNSDDNFLSLYKNNFASNLHMGWTFNPNNIVKFYNLYSDLMKFWKLNYNNFIYEIDYDKLVINNKVEIEKLLNYCELNIEDNCFNHHKNKNPITTVSMYQARKPIYRSSLNSAKTYSKYLEKYFNLLNKIN